MLCHLEHSKMRDTILILSNLTVQHEEMTSKQFKCGLMLTWAGLWAEKAGSWWEAWGRQGGWPGMQAFCFHVPSHFLKLVIYNLHGLPVPVTDAQSMHQPTDWCSAWISSYISVHICLAQCPIPLPPSREANKTLDQIWTAPSVLDSWIHCLLLLKDHETSAPGFCYSYVPITNDPSNHIPGRLQRWKWDGLGQWIVQHGTVPPQLGQLFGPHIAPMSLAGVKPKGRTSCPQQIGATTTSSVILGSVFQIAT